MMFGTYKENDVTILLKDISGIITPLGTEEREKLIQSGVHYSEMLPIEYVPSDDYIDIYKKTLKLYANLTAKAVASVAEKIYFDKGKDAVLVTLARAETSIGVLIKRYIQYKFDVNVSHYTISIIRGKGIDKNAMNYILSKHNAEDIQFVDGWTGKGAIQRELNSAMTDYPRVSSGLAVLSDPAYISEKCGTHTDFFIASSCLNSTVSGLLSRTFYRNDVIEKDDFHGAAFYENLLNEDVTYEFIDAIVNEFPNVEPMIDNADDGKHISGLDEVNNICKEFNVSDINFVKPSIGETTRVLLRRVPWKILVHSLNDYEHLGHIYQLAKEKNVPVIEYPLSNYRACGIIKSLADT